MRPNPPSLPLTLNDRACFVSALTCPVGHLCARRNLSDLVAVPRWGDRTEPAKWDGFWPGDSGRCADMVPNFPLWGESARPATDPPNCND